MQEKRRGKVVLFPSRIHSILLCSVDILFFLPIGEAL